jgi:hypothetical protein
MSDIAAATHNEATEKVRCDDARCGNDRVQITFAAMSSRRPRGEEGRMMGHVDKGRKRMAGHWRPWSTLLGASFSLWAGAAAIRAEGEMISNVKAELPGGRFPICLIVDDPTPCVNPLYFYRKDVDKQPPGKFKSWEGKGTMVRDIPLAFLKEYAEWISRNNIRGKFSVIPFPMGLGSVAEGLEGYDKKEVDEWIKTAREKIAPVCDLGPEMLTHTNGLDLKTRKLLSTPEPDLISGMNVEQMTEYMATGIEILKKAGLTATGVTQPNYYKGDQASVYAKAVLAAVKKVNGEKLVWYFIDIDAKSANVLPKILYLDKANKEASVSIIAGADEPMWACVSGGGDVPKMADYYIGADGQKGRFLDLMKGESYLVFYTHWQSLYGNGTKKGFLTVQEIAERVKNFLGDRVKWMKTSEIARYFVASQTHEVKIEGRGKSATLAFKFPFSCPEFTVSCDAAVDGDGKIKVACDGKPMLEVSSRKELKENSWFREGKKIYFSFPLQETTKIEIGY